MCSVVAETRARAWFRATEVIHRVRSEFGSLVLEVGEQSRLTDLVTCTPVSLTPWDCGPVSRGSGVTFEKAAVDWSAAVHASRGDRAL